VRQEGGQYFVTDAQGNKSEVVTAMDLVWHEDDLLAVPPARDDVALSSSEIDFPHFEMEQSADLESGGLFRMDSPVLNENLEQESAAQSDFHSVDFVNFHRGTSLAQRGRIFAGQTIDENLDRGFMPGFLEQKESNTNPYSFFTSGQSCELNASASKAQVTVNTLNNRRLKYADGRIVPKELAVGQKRGRYFVPDAQESENQVFTEMALRKKRSRQNKPMALQQHSLSLVPAASSTIDFPNAVAPRPELQQRADFEWGSLSNMDGSIFLSEGEQVQEDKEGEDCMDFPAQSYFELMGLVQKNGNNLNNFSISERQSDKTSEDLENCWNTGPPLS
jgi:hypothetical protein